MLQSLQNGEIRQPFQHLAPEASDDQSTSHAWTEDAPQRPRIQPRDIPAWGKFDILHIHSEDLIV